MSTDIVHWQAPEPGDLKKVVSLDAIKIFLAITIPCMILTFIGAYGFYRWTKWYERKKMNRLSATAQP